MKRWLIAAGCSVATLLVAAWAILSLAGWYWDETRPYWLYSMPLLLFIIGTLFFYNKLDDK